MRLYYSAASPYARKVLVAAHELGLADRIELVTVTVSPVKPDPEVNRRNPLGKVPALECEDGSVLYDSRVIVSRLDRLAGGGRLLPEGTERDRVETGQALADGLLDTALLLRYETFARPEALRWPEWIEGQAVKIEQALDAMETAAPRFRESFAIDAIATAAALGYLDFRFADRPWRPGRPQLSAFYDAAAARPSMQATAPG